MVMTIELKIIASHRSSIYCAAIVNKRARNTRPKVVSYFRYSLPRYLFIANAARLALHSACSFVQFSRKAPLGRREKLKRVKTGRRQHSAPSSGPGTIASLFLPSETLESSPPFHPVLLAQVCILFFSLNQKNSEKSQK